MRLLAYTSPARGHLYPVVPILLELRRRGHDMRLVALASELERLVALGIEADPLSPVVEAVELEDWRARSQLGGSRRVLQAFATRAEPEAVDLQDAIERHRPDVLLLDVNCWGGATVAEASGLPWAMFSPYLLMARSREAPPFGLGLAPMSGPLGRARDTVLGAFSELFVDRTVLPTLNSLRARHGLAPLARFGELAQRPARMLVTSVEGFEYPRLDWAKNVRFVGPLDWSPPQQAPAWLEELADPLVLVTCSSERQADRVLLETALQALPRAGMSVLGTSAAHDPDDFSVPAGSRVVRFLSHDLALERAACVVCHGGMGITQKALAAGVPVVVVPFGRDQLETAQRVQRAGAGMRLAARRLSNERLAATVRQALEMRDGASQVGKRLTAAGGAATAADEVLNLVSPSIPPEA